MTGDSTHASIATPDERDLVAQLAEAVLERTAPEELVVFPETADEYFRDPEAVLDPKHRDEAVGFGLDLALLTPFVLAVATPVVRFLLDAATEALQDEAKASIVTAVRRMLRRDSTAASPGAGPALALSSTQLSSLRDLAYSRARAVGVADTQAALIADAVVGGVVVG